MTTLRDIHLYRAGGQAGYIVAWSTKLAMYLRIWKWDAISTYLHCYPGRQKEMVLGALCASVPFLLLTLFYSNGAIRKSRPQATNWKFNFLF